MASDFDQNGHKNLELLRFYVSNDIRSVDDKLQEKNSRILGCFIASLIDYLIVFVFGDVYKAVVMNTLSVDYVTLNNKICKSTVLTSIVGKIQSHPIISTVVSLLLLVGLFLLIERIVRSVSLLFIQRKKESGRDGEKLEAAQLKTVDDFDNIACDGLLICQNYKEKYSQTKIHYLQQFYLFEILHNLTKAGDIYDKIHRKKDRYVSSSSKDLIDSYRLDNFVEFFHAMLEFLLTELKISVDADDNELKSDIDNLIIYNNEWLPTRRLELKDFSPKPDSQCELASQL